MGIEIPDVKTIDEASMAALVPLPQPDANKYSRGVLALVAGCAAYPGAACMAAFAGQRVGAGYVEVFCAPESVLVLRGYRPSLVVRAWDEGVSARLPHAHEGHPAACALGSGFDANETFLVDIALQVIEHGQTPLVIDGGALSTVATEAGMSAVKQRGEEGLATILTPHGGEAARLLTGAWNAAGDAVREKLRALGYAHLDEGPSVGEDIATFLMNNHHLFAVLLADLYECTVVLKGPQTYISDGRQCLLMDAGTPALAKAGTGDVLAGMIGGFLAQGLSPLDAAALGTTLHAACGRHAADELTEVCVEPEDVIEAIPTVMKAWLASCAS